MVNVDSITVTEVEDFPSDFTDTNYWGNFNFASYPVYIATSGGGKNKDKAYLYVANAHPAGDYDAGIYMRTDYTFKPGMYVLKFEMQWEFPRTPFAYNAVPLQVRFKDEDSNKLLLAQTTSSANTMMVRQGSYAFTFPAYYAYNASKPQAWRMREKEDEWVDVKYIMVFDREVAGRLLIKFVKQNYITRLNITQPKLYRVENFPKICFLRFDDVADHAQYWLESLNENNIKKATLCPIGDLAAQNALDVYQEFAKQGFCLIYHVYHSPLHGIIELGAQNCYDNAAFLHVIEKDKFCRQNLRAKINHVYRGDNFYQGGWQETGDIYHLNGGTQVGWKDYTYDGNPYGGLNIVGGLQYIKEYLRLAGNRFGWAGLIFHHVYPDDTTPSESLQWKAVNQDYFDEIIAAVREYGFAFGDYNDLVALWEAL